MSLSLRHAVLLYSSEDLSGVSVGTISPPVDEVVASGDSLLARIAIADLVPEVSGYGSTEISGEVDYSPTLEAVSGRGTSNVVIGTIFDYVPVVSGSGYSEALDGVMQINPQRDSVSGVAYLSIAKGAVEQTQSISGYGSGMLVGHLRVRPDKDMIFAGGSSAFIAVKGPVVVAPSVDIVYGFGYSGSILGVASIDGKPHTVVAAGTSSWAQDITADGSIRPRKCVVAGQGSSWFAAAVLAIGRVRAKKHSVYATGVHPVYGIGVISQRSDVSGKGTIVRTDDGLAFSRDPVIIPSIQSQSLAPLEYQRDAQSAPNRTSPPSTNPLQFTR